MFSTYLIICGADGRKISGPNLRVSEDFNGSKLQCLAGERRERLRRACRNVEAILIACTSECEFFN